MKGMLAQRAAAFFDFDGTLAATTAVHHYYHLNSQIQSSHWARWYFYCCIVLYYLVDKFSRSAFDLLFYRNYRGLCVETCCIKSNTELKARMVKKLFPDALEHIELHRSAGHKLILITGSPDFIVKPLAMELGFDHIVSAQLKQKAGLFTGSLMRKPLHKEQKAKEIKEIARIHNLDLEESYAYGDSVNDIHMLAAVGNPVVVNGDAIMRAIARKRNWCICDWSRHASQGQVSKDSA